MAASSLALPSNFASRSPLDSPHATPPLPGRALLRALKNPPFVGGKTVTRCRIRIRCALSDGDEQGFAPPRPNVSVPWTERSIILPEFMEKKSGVQSVVDGREDEVLIDDEFIEDENLFKSEYKPLKPGSVTVKKGGRPKEEPVETESLIPEKWRNIQHELNKPKREKKKEYLESIVGRKKEIEIENFLSTDLDPEKSESEFESDSQSTGNDLESRTPRTLRKLYSNSDLDSNSIENNSTKKYDEKLKSGGESDLGGLSSPTQNVSARFPPIDPFLSHPNPKGLELLDDFFRREQNSTSIDNIFDEKDDDDDDGIHETNKDALSHDCIINKKERKEEKFTLADSTKGFVYDVEEEEEEEDDWTVIDEAEDDESYLKDLVKAREHRFESSVDFAAKKILQSKNVTSEKWKLGHSFSATGQKLVMATLVKNGLNLEEKDKDGYTALQKAIMNGRDAMAKTLIRLGASAKIIDDDGATLLHYCAQNGSTQTARVLVKSSGMNINAVDNCGWTPLHVACQSGRLDMVKTLLLLGANPHIKNNDGLSALDLALEFGQQFGFPTIAATMRNPPTVIPDRRLKIKKKRIQKSSFIKRKS